MSGFTNTVGKKIIVRYWPVAVGRTGAIRLILEDNQVEYEFQAHDGSTFDDKVFAVPAIQVNGEWLGQSIVCLQKVADITRCQVPTDEKYNEASCLNTLNDLHSEIFGKRTGGSKFSKAEATGWLTNRAEKILKVCDAQFGNDGTFYYGNTPSASDYLLLTLYVCLKVSFEDLGAASLMKFPNLASSVNAMLQRDGIKKQVDVDGGKLFGLNYFPWAFEAISD